MLGKVRALQLDTGASIDLDVIPEKNFSVIDVTRFFNFETAGRGWDCYSQRHPLPIWCRGVVTSILAENCGFWDTARLFILPFLHLTL
mgnify:CR=1 FL=1